MRGSSEKPLNIMCTSPKKRQDRYSLPNCSLVGCSLVLKNTVAVTSPTNATFKEQKMFQVRNIGSYIYYKENIYSSQ